MSKDTWDSSLYGIRQPKTKHKEISSATTLAFTSQLSTLLSASSSSGSKTSNGRPRPPSSKQNLFTSHNKNAKKRALRDLEDDGESSVFQTHSKGLDPDNPSILHRSKRKMEEKARLYSAMKRGDYVAPDGAPEQLVDFDRKWAENQLKDPNLNENDTSSDDQASESDDETIEYQDDRGRTRQGTKAEAARMERKKKNMLLGAEELDRMSARPARPQGVIYGDAVQVAAFNPDEPIATAMEALAQKRDKSLTPPPETHYEADKEIRTKGVGFFAFSKDEKVRKQEMEALEQERAQTERFRVEREEKKEKRRMEIEERRKAIAEKRSKKQADSFLEGLGAELEPDSGGKS